MNELTIDEYLKIEKDTLLRDVHSKVMLLNKPLEKKHFL